MIDRARSRLTFLLFFALSACSGPAFLSGVDRIAGGGNGVSRVAEGVVYGDHGQRLDVYAPRAAMEGGEALPVIIFVHGGSWENGSRGGYAFAGRGLARLGAVAVVIDYRKLPDHRFPDFVVDTAEAVAWTSANAGQYGGDAKRVFLAGHSAGAHIAMLAALDPRYLAEAGAAPDALTGVIGISGPYDFYPFTVDSARRAFAGADPETTQPINYARGDAPPILLLHGEADEVVLPRNSIDLARAIEAAGGEATLRLYPGLGHAEAITALTPLFDGKADIKGAIAVFLADHPRR